MKKLFKTLFKKRKRKTIGPGEFIETQIGTKIFAALLIDLETDKILDVMQQFSDYNLKMTKK